MSSSSGKKAVQHIIERWAIATKMAARFAKGDTTPGFSHALGLEHIDAATTSWDQSTRTLTTKHTIDKNLCWNNGGGTASLSTYLALIDEQSTHAVLGAQPQSLRAGVSVQLQADLFEAAPVGSEVEIVSSVTRLGRTLAFCEAQIRGNDGRVHCRGVHVKYLPMEGILMDSVMSQKWVWPYVKAYMDRIPDISMNTPRDSLNDVIDPHLDWRGMGSATFHVGKQHTNPFVSLHGGCQAILMEKVGQELANDQLGATSQLTSIQSQYHTAGKGQVDIQANVLEQTPDEVHMQVVLSRSKDGTIVSNGNLRWTKK